MTDLVTERGEHHAAGDHEKAEKAAVAHQAGAMVMGPGLTKGLFGRGSRVSVHGNDEDLVGWTTDRRTEFSHAKGHTRTSCRPCAPTRAD